MHILATRSLPSSFAVTRTSSPDPEQGVPDRQIARNSCTERA